MVSACPLISKSSCSCTNPLVAVLRAPITIGITITFMFHSLFIFFFFFCIPLQFPSTYLSFRFLSVLLWGQPRQQSPQFGRFLFFFVDYYKVWSSVRDLVIRLYLKIPENFMSLILQDRCWVVYIPFQFLAQFPVDDFAYPILSSFILFLC